MKRVSKARIYREPEGSLKVARSSKGTHVVIHLMLALGIPTLTSIEGGTVWDKI